MSIRERVAPSRVSTTLLAYLALTKPRVVALIVFTAIVGTLLSTPGLPPLHPLFWGNLGMTLRLAPGEMVLVPEGRLHGSTIESDECTYHQPIIPDAWVRPLIDGLEPTVGA